MNEFNLTEDVLTASWKRYKYTVEAETLDEAIRLVIDRKVDSESFEDLFDTETEIPIEDNSMCSTREIYVGDDFTPVYKNNS